MDHDRYVLGWLTLISSQGREESFTFRLTRGDTSEGHRMIAWLPGAVVPLVILGSEWPCLIDPLVDYVEAHGMPIATSVRSTGD